MALHLQTTPPEDRLRVREGAVAPYLRAVRAHILLFTLIVLAALVGGIAYLSQRSPLYEATAQLLITPLPQDETDLPRAEPPAGLRRPRAHGADGRGVDRHAGLGSAHRRAPRRGLHSEEGARPDRRQAAGRQRRPGRDRASRRPRRSGPDRESVHDVGAHRAPPRAAHRGRGRNRAGKRAAGHHAKAVPLGHRACAPACPAENAPQWEGLDAVELAAGDCAELTGGTVGAARGRALPAGRSHDRRGRCAGARAHRLAHSRRGRPRQARVAAGPRAPSQALAPGGKGGGRLTLSRPASGPRGIPEPPDPARSEQCRAPLRDDHQRLDRGWQDHLGHQPRGRSRGSWVPHAPHGPRPA